MAKKIDDDWELRVPTLSIHPDAATRNEVARLAAELMVVRHKISQIRDITLEERPDIAKIKVLCFDVLGPVI